MKVRDINDFLGLDMNEMQKTKTLTSISHWVRKIRKAKELEVTEDKDKKALDKLELLKIVTLKKVKKGKIYKAKITEEGKELYIDFFKHGYYPQDLGI